MNGQELLIGMGFIDEKYVMEAEGKRTPAWKGWGALAACLCIIMAGLWTQWRWPFSENDSSQVADRDIYTENVDTEEMDTIQIAAVVVCIDAMTENGFTATVVELVNIEDYPVGTELNVILTDNAREVNPDSAYGEGEIVEIRFFTIGSERATVYADAAYPVTVPVEKGGVP